MAGARSCPPGSGLGSDILRDNDRVQLVTSPFDDGEELVAVPALTWTPPSST